METKRFFIQTIGCQMNVYDSDRIAAALGALHYDRTDHLANADMVIVNTCAIREKAEQKVFSFLGRLGRLKKSRPNLVIGVGGCVAQQMGAKILERAPYLDLVFGTHAVDRLTGLIERVKQEQGPVVDVKLGETFQPSQINPDKDSKQRVSRFVTIMQGCDNYCSYCVVPYVRGRETSRPPDHILTEIHSLVAAGVREITLLGQNVNSYGQKEGLCSFPELLARVNDVAGLARIRFTTSHPKDLSLELCHAFRDLKKLCRHIHLPVQSGANRVLKRMNRRYTREHYLELVHSLRTIQPDMALTSDFIVGFPGETRSDFDQTLELVETVRFDSIFAFNYSDRPNAPATRLPQKVADDTKRRRLGELLALQEKITLQKHQALIGSTREILVEGRGKRKVPAHRTVHDPSAGPTRQWTGRTSTNRIVHFALDPNHQAFNRDLTGRLVQIRIEHAYAHSLRGTPVEIEGAQPIAKGDKFYAA